MKPVARSFQDYFSSRYPKDEPGFAAAVIKGGRTIFQGGFGLANLATREPITPQTRFPIGSNSKLFTAAMIYRLEMDGKLQSSDPVLKHLPDLPAFFKPVRLDHFIHHSSGLSIPGELRLFMGRPRTPNPPEQQPLAMIRRLPGLQAKPGAEYIYSSSTYGLLAKVVEKVGGRPFDEQVEERLFRPLGMSRTRLPTPRHLTGQFLRAEGYEKFTTGRWRNDDQPIRDPGPCFVMSPAEDMAAFVKRLREPGPFAELFKRMQKAGPPFDHGGWAPVAYGGGFRMFKHPRAGRLVFHGGLDGAFHTDFWWMPDLDLGLVLLGNRDDFWGWRHFDAVLDILLGKAKPRRPAKAKLPKAVPAVQALKPSPAKPVPIRQADFLGRYYCYPILRHYAVVKDGRGLRFKMPPTGDPKHQQADGRLQALGGDRFALVVFKMLEQKRDLRGEAVFTRDRRGKVTGFTLKLQSAWMNLKELEFKKVRR